MALSGPLKLRLDYRHFVLSDDHDQSLYRLPYKQGFGLQVST